MSLFSEDFSTECAKVINEDSPLTALSKLTQLLCKEIKAKKFMFLQLNLEKNSYSEQTFNQENSDGVQFSITDILDSDPELKKILEGTSNE